MKSARSIEKKKKTSYKNKNTGLEAECKPVILELLSPFEAQWPYHHSLMVNEEY